MQNTSPFPRKVVGSFNISVSIDEASNCLKIYSPAFFWEPFALGIGLVICCVLIIYVSKLDENKMLINLISAIAILFLFLFLFMLSLMKRTILSVFDLPKGALFYRKGGIYSSRLDEAEQEIELSSISRVGLKKIYSRYGDTFQVFLVVKRISRLEITGTGLSFADAHSCAEAIREFLNIQQKIQAEG